MVISIENLLVARYAEIHPDGTLTVIGAGISQAARLRDADIHLTLAGTILVEGGGSERGQDLTLRLRDPEGEVVAEAQMHIREVSGQRVRIPLAIPLNIPASGGTGDWQIELSDRYDLRVLHLEIVENINRSLLD